jgi:hypothetical protein
MSSARRGDQRPSRVNYHKTGRRAKNKARRITRCNGVAYLNQWRRDGHAEKT